MIKQFYGSSNKKAVEDQFAKLERRQTLLRRQLDLDDQTVEEMEEIDPCAQLHHAMANTRRRDNTLSLPRFLLEHQGDPALKVAWSLFNYVYQR